jgi:hypothetical protein
MHRLTREVCRRGPALARVALTCRTVSRANTLPALSQQSHTLLDALLKGDRNALARTITLGLLVVCLDDDVGHVVPVESRRREKYEQAQTMLTSLLHARNNRSTFRIALTGYKHVRISVCC